MLSVLSYGRLVARAVLGGLSQTDGRDYSLVTASCGFGKDFRKGTLKNGVLDHGGVLKKGVLEKGTSYGDDACFIARNKGADVLGVADGVGGWRDYGVDPSQFSATLMRTCERLVRDGRFTPSHPVGILTSGYYELLQNKIPLLGSSTACIVVLDRRSHRLHTCNLGDSGFLVVRGGEVVHRPDAADSASFDVQLGDIILTATDRPTASYASVLQTAESIAQQAHDLAYDPHYMSPFAQFACDNGLNVRGGKPDDITVLLSIVAEYTD
ncbi:hypothetical protein CRUP_004551 [Coryphaenoides rupestris]|nr:hypothetical protein CRUP_004551 [Coryphaenoides rupestris]